MKTTSTDSTSKRLTLRTSVRAGLVYSGEPGGSSSYANIEISYLGDTGTHEVGHVRTRR